jgi:starch phosphorylase
MKAAINGTLNLSVLDGWFPEGYEGRNAFAIGRGEEFADPDHQDEFESRQLYRILEEKVIPAFYNRADSTFPAEWVAMQKHALATLAGAFSADRMVREYAERFYFPASDRYRRLLADNGAAVRGLIGWKRYINERWGTLSFQDVRVEAGSAMMMGDVVNVRATVTLGGLGAGDIHVEAYHGEIDPAGMVTEGTVTALELTGTDGNLAYYAGTVRPSHPGHAGLTVRAVPWHADLTNPMEMNLVTWGR